MGAVTTAWLGGLVLWLALSVAPAAAQDSDLAARQAVAAEYIGMSLDSVDNTALEVSAMILQEIRVNQPEVYAEKEAEITAVVEDAMTEAMRESMIGLDRQMASVFTMEELVALRDFYASPEGRSVMSKLPEMMREVVPSAIQDAMQNTGAMIEELKALGIDVR